MRAFGKEPHRWKAVIGIVEIKTCYIIFSGIGMDRIIPPCFTNKANKIHWLTVHQLVYLVHFNQTLQFLDICWIISHGFAFLVPMMVSSVFSHGFPIIFPRFSHGFQQIPAATLCQHPGQPTFVLAPCHSHKDLNLRSERRWGTPCYHPGFLYGITTVY